jgi:aerobic carbon-monoxide dehydrogenase large subunit
VTTRLFGERVARSEDRRLLTGRGRYTGDFEPAAAHAAFVRSDFAHARITGIDVAAAQAVPGVLGVFTYADLADGFAERLPLLVPSDKLISPRTQHALAKDEACYAGEVLAMVVARDRYVAEDALERVIVEYDPLPAAVDLEQAAGPNPPLAHLDMADNLAGLVTEETGDVDAAFAAAPHVYDWTFRMERSASMPIETRGVVAHYDEREDRLLVHDATQAPTGVRFGLAMLFGMDPDRVHVVAPDVGGGFGVKVIQFYPEEVLVPWAARRLGEPVKWIEDRREHFLGSNHERGQIHHVRVGAADDGRILALEDRFLHDTGAYCSYGLILPIITAAQLPGPYDLENYRYALRSIFTNTVPTSPFRGAGRPHAAYVMERVIERVSKELTLDSLDVRRRNFVKEFPHHVGVTFQDGGPTVYDSGDYPKGLATLLEQLDLERTKTEIAAARAEGRTVGLGFGAYVEGTGIGPYEGASVSINPDGTVSVATAHGSQGQAHETVFAQVVADELQVPFERIHVTTGDTRRLGYGVGTFASRTAVVAGNAVLLATTEVKRQAAAVAAHILEVAPEDVVFADGAIHVAGAPDRSIPLGRLAMASNPTRYAFGADAEEGAKLSQLAYAGGDRPLPEGSHPGLAATEYYSPTSGVFGFGFHAAVIEIDRETGHVHILRYVVHHDSGRIINPMVVEGQIHGGVAQGIGGALYERIAYGEEGQILNATFMDFLMVTAAEMPRIEEVHTETPSPNNPLGIKGVGEAGTIPVSATIANAISDALQTPVDHMPVTPEEVLGLAGKIDPP